MFFDERNESVINVFALKFEMSKYFLENMF